MSLTLVLRDSTHEARPRRGGAGRAPPRGRHRGPRLAAVGVRAPLEREIDAAEVAGAVLPDWPARRKTGWLDVDLRALGAPTPPDVVVALVGPLLAPGLPRRFFDAYRPGRGRMWREVQRCGWRDGSTCWQAQRRDLGHGQPSPRRNCFVRATRRTRSVGDETPPVDQLQQGRPVLRWAERRSGGASRR